jgi:hypothetical protein
MAHSDFSSQPQKGSEVFSPAEIAEFRTDDKRAGAAIVVLMAGIFSLGLVGYLGVCWWVS